MHSDPIKEHLVEVFEGYADLLTGISSAQKTGKGWSYRFSFGEVSSLLEDRLQEAEQPPSLFSSRLACCRKFLKTIPSAC